MQKKKFFIGLAVLAVLLSTISVSSVVLAASKNKRSNTEKPKQVQILTEEQKQEMQTKMEAIKSAIEAGDYDAWVTAVKAVNENSPELKTVTKDNFSDYVAKYKQREADMKDRQTKMEAVQAAITANDYDAWVTAEKALDANSPLLNKITSDNFSKYVEASNLRSQADSIFKDLGVMGDEGGPGGPGGDMHGGPGGDMPSFNNSQN